MTPEIAEGIKAGLSLTAAVCFAVGCGYVVFQFLTLCDNVAAIKNKVVNNRGEYE